MSHLSVATPKVMDFVFTFYFYEYEEGERNKNPRDEEEGEKREKVVNHQRAQSANLSSVVIVQGRQVTNSHSSRSLTITTITISHRQSLDRTIAPTVARSANGHGRPIGG